MLRATVSSALIAAAISGFAGLAYAQAPASDAVPHTVFDDVTTSDTPKITLTSTSVTAGQAIADTYSQNGDNKSPQLSWAAGPASTKSYVVVVQDPIAGRPAPVQHWIIYDIPADVMTLPEDVAKEVSPGSPKGAMQATAGKAIGYRGPKPPAGQTHTYVFQVFATDQPLAVDAATVNAAMLTEALKGHVIAAGEFTAPYTGK